MGRSKYALLNTLVQVILELCTIVSGFLVPRLIMESFGSATNGLVVSITQFLGYLSLLQSGIGGVAKASLYKPLATCDSKAVNSMVNAIEGFFRKIAGVSVFYIAALMVVFPVFIYKDMDVRYTALLIAIIGFGTFAQYYFGITYQFLLQADQRYYIYSISQIIVVLANTLFAVVLIRRGCSIHVVKLASAAVFVIRPMWLSYYCKRLYKLNRREPADTSLIKQRWDGFGHTIAYFVHSKTDVFLLTVFTSMDTVSVYSVYYSVVSGISLLLNTVATSVQAAFGNMIAKKEHQNIRTNYYAYVCLNNFIVTALFSTTMITIIPFMKVYTVHMTDTEYIRPLFSGLIVTAEALFCIRMPYQTIVLAAGHYKQTKKGAYAEAGINIAVSLVLMFPLGMIGVAIGTICAMTFRTIQYILYLSNNLLHESAHRQFLLAGIDIVILVLAYVAGTRISSISLIANLSGFPGWIVFALITTVVMLVLCASVFIIFDSKYFKIMLKTTLNSMMRKVR